MLEFSSIQDKIWQSRLEGCLHVKIHSSLRFQQTHRNQRATPFKPPIISLVIWRSVCEQPRHPCHGAIHQPLDFPALAPPVNQLGPDGPNMAHVCPVGPHRRPCGPSLDHRRQGCSLDPHCWMAGDFSNPWKLKYPGMTSSMWCDWVQLQHRCSIIDLKTPLELSLEPWHASNVDLNDPIESPSIESQFQQRTVYCCFISSTSSCFGELLNMSRFLNSFRHFSPLVKR